MSQDNILYGLLVALSWTEIVNYKKINFIFEKSNIPTGLSLFEKKKKPKYIGL